jgi:hypothetical protein
MPMRSKAAIASIPTVTPVCCFEHDPEKWRPVFGQDHAQSI